MVIVTTLSSLIQFVTLHHCTRIPGGGGGSIKRVVLHRARTASALWQLLVVKPPVHHPKMHPPKQPIEPQKSAVASARPVSLGFYGRE